MGRIEESLAVRGFEGSGHKRTRAVDQRIMSCLETLREIGRSLAQVQLAESSVVELLKRN